MMLPLYISRSQTGLKNIGGLALFHRFCLTYFKDKEIIVVLGTKSSTWSGKWEASMSWSKNMFCSASINPWLEKAAHRK